MEKKKDNRTGRAIKNSIAALVCKALLVVVPFVVRAVTIQKLGVEYLGLNGLFTSILTMLSLSVTEKEMPSPWAPSLSVLSKISSFRMCRLFP